MRTKTISFLVALVGVNLVISCTRLTATPAPDAFGKFRCIDRTAESTPPSESPPLPASEQSQGTPQAPFLTKPLCPDGQVPIVDTEKLINEPGQYVPKGNPLIGPVNATREQFFQAQSDQSEIIIENLRAPEDLYKQGPGTSRQQIARESSGSKVPKGNPLIGPVSRTSEQFSNSPAAQREAIIKSLRSPQDLYVQGLTTNNLQPPACNGIPYFGSCFYYASASYARAADGAGVTMSIERPAYDGSGGPGHTLDEISVQGGTNNGNIIEIGWNVSTTQYSNVNPHLFVFHWIDWKPTCYDTCAWQQYSATYFPGMDLGSLVDRNVYVGYVFYQGNWWAWFDNQWLGYFPGSEWGGAYTQSSRIQWFGEVATANGIPPHTDMGNGRFPPDSTAARNSTLCDVSAADWVCWYRNQQAWYATNPSYYDINSSGFGETRYGGRGE